MSVQAAAQGDVIRKDYGTIKMKIEEVPPNVSWGKVEVEENGLQKWKGSGQSPAGEVTYFCLSEGAPEFDRGTKKWKNIELIAPILASVGQPGKGDLDLLKMVDQSNFDEIKECLEVNK